MIKIAFLGASSQIAKDLICSMVHLTEARLLLYVRDLPSAERWLNQQGIFGRCTLYLYAEYGKESHDVVINFVGVGDPHRASQMGAAIFNITQEFDDLVLSNLKSNPDRRYIFLSSGAAYGSSFLEPARIDTKAKIDINTLTSQEYYAVAKIHAEAKHRALSNLAITDIRVFNYFSRTQDIEARFFITDIIRAIRDGVTLHTSPDYMMRDFLHPSDFYQLIDCILKAIPQNHVVDCYSRAPIDKPTLLELMKEKLGLDYKITHTGSGVNATGAKPNYYSLNRKAAELGYQPTYSSQEGILIESCAFLGRDATRTKEHTGNHDANIQQT
jgi:nucleoside-diphosphate-sugar epimerase